MSGVRRGFGGGVARALRSSGGRVRAASREAEGGNGTVAAVAAVLAATALFGTVGTARVLGPDASSWSVDAVRLAAGAAALVVIACWAGVAWPALGALGRVRATWWAGAGMAGFQGTFLAAVEHPRGQAGRRAPRA